MAETVAHVVQKYLRPTETFIYDTVTGHRDFRPIVLTNRAKNVDRFPFEPVYTQPRAYTPGWVWERFWYHLTGASPSFESALRKNHAAVLHAHFGPVGVALTSLKKRASIPFATSLVAYLQIMAFCAHKKRHYFLVLSSLNPTTLKHVVAVLAAIGPNLTFDYQRYKARLTNILDLPANHIYTLLKHAADKFTEHVA